MSATYCTLCAEFHRLDASLRRPKKKAVAKSVAVLMIRGHLRNSLKSMKYKRKIAKTPLDQPAHPKATCEWKKVKKESARKRKTSNGHGRYSISGFKASTPACSTAWFFVFLRHAVRTSIPPAARTAALARAPISPVAMQVRLRMQTTPR